MSRKRDKHIGIIIIDIIMMVLLLINLSLIIFDWFFFIGAVKNLFYIYAEPFYHFYNNSIHKNFFEIDLIFISIFITELVIRWVVAVVNKTYHRWFFYPFVHWYDVLGCIPIASFRFLRILRVISIFYRLQRLSIIDLKNTYLYRVFNRYYKILVEEVSDRVIINVLNGFQDELRRDNPVTDTIAREILAPRKDILTEWLFQKIRVAAAGTYQSHQEEIHLYLKQLIGEALKNNKEVKSLKQIPVVGSYISKTLEKAVADITLNTVNGAMADISSDEQHALFHSMTENLMEGLLSKEERAELNSAFKEVMMESLELIKAHVEIQQWKLKELEEKEAALRTVNKANATNTNRNVDNDTRSI